MEQGQAVYNVDEINQLNDNYHVLHAEYMRLKTKDDRRLKWGFWVALAFALIFFIIIIVLIVKMMRGKSVPAPEI